MAGRLAALVRKEFTELIHERTVLIGIIVMPLVMFALMGAATSAATERLAEEAARPLAGVVCGEDPLAPLLAAALNATLDGSLCGPGTPVPEGYDYAVFVPDGAWANVSSGRPARVYVVVRVSGFTFTQQAAIDRVEAVIDAASRAVASAVLAEAGVNATPEFLAKPIRVEAEALLAGRVVSVDDLRARALSLTFTAMILVILFISSMQVAATSIGLEREAKTVEMLLASPLSPREIIIGKVVGVTGVVLLGALSFAAGLAIYYNSVTEAAAAGGAPVRPVFTPQAAAVTAAGLAVTLYVTVVLGLAIGLAAQDVRGAQLLAGQAGFLLMLPYILVFTGLAPDPALSAALLADPLYPALAAAYNALAGDGAGAAVALAALAVHATVWTVVAARLLTPERLLVGLRLPAWLTRRGAAYWPGWRRGS